MHCERNSLEAFDQWVKDLDSREEFGSVGGGEGDFEQQSHHGYRHREKTEVGGGGPSLSCTAEPPRRDGVACSDEKPQQESMVGEKFDDVGLAGKFLARLVPAADQTEEDGDCENDETSWISRVAGLALSEIR